MKTIQNLNNITKDLYSNDGDSVTVQPGVCRVEDKFTLNLPPKVIIKEDK